MANPNWKLALLRVFLIAMAGLWVFSPALCGDWLWDDSRLVVGNYHLRTLAGLEKIWLAAPMADYWPLTWTLLWFEWHLWKNLTLGYHACSLALHLLSGYLIWHLFRRIGLRWAWLGGLLFVIHPLTVESVAWISEIKNTLSLPLFLLSLSAYMDGDEGRNGYLRSLLYYLAAMLCKSSVVMLPAILLLYCWWKHGRITRHDLQKTLPFFCIALVLGSLTLYLQTQYDTAIGTAAEPAMITRLIGAGIALLFYLGKFLDPTGLMPVYPRSMLAPHSLLQLAALPLLVVALVSLWTRRQGWGRHTLFGFGFFALNLLPVLGLLHMSYFNISPVADHLVYLPMIGLVGLAVAGLEALARQLSRPLRPLLFAVTGAWVLLLAWQAHSYAGQYFSGEKLWTYTLNLNPDAVTARDNLGLALLQGGRVAAAQEQFAAALQIDPSDSTAHNDLAVALLQTKQFPETIRECEAALRLNPNYAEAHDNMALALAQMGRIPEAIDHENAALQIEPDAVAVRRRMGDLLRQAGRPAEAEAQDEIAARLDPEANPAPGRN